MTLRADDRPVPQAPKERGGRLVEPTKAPPAAVTAPPASSLAPTLVQPKEAPARAPTESSKGVRLVEPSPASSSAAPAAAQAAPASSAATAAPSSEFRRVLGLPARPRLRVSFWFEGDSLACEALLMDEKREPLRRSRVTPDAPDDPTLGRVFAYFATKLVNELREAGALVLAPTFPAEPAPSSSADDSEPPSTVPPPTPDEVPTKG